MNLTGWGLLETVLESPAQFRNWSFPLQQMQIIIENHNWTQCRGRKSNGLWSAQPWWIYLQRAPASWLRNINQEGQTEHKSQNTRNPVSDCFSEKWLHKSDIKDSTIRHAHGQERKISWSPTLDKELQSTNDYWETWPLPEINTLIGYLIQSGQPWNYIQTKMDSAGCIHKSVCKLREICTIIIRKKRLSMWGCGLRQELERGEGRTKGTLNFSCLLFNFFFIL